MTDTLMLDAGPLARLAHPTKHHDILAWLRALLNAGATVIIPEIVDYEVRRGLLAVDAGAQIGRLNDLKAALIYLPLTTPVMLQAAEFWADLRKHGLQTADEKELNADAILAAQALDANATVVTENAGHLARMVTVKSWRQTP